MINCKLETTQFFYEVHLEDGGDTLMVDNTLYQHLVRIFIYLTHTQTNISYIVGIFSRYM
jgi:hypothetical protein